MSWVLLEPQPNRPAHVLRYFSGLSRFPNFILETKAHGMTTMFHINDTESVKMCIVVEKFE